MPRRPRRGTGRHRARGTNPNSASSHDAIDAARLGARHRRPAVAIGDDDEAGAQRRPDDLLDPLGEVGRVEQRRLGGVRVAVALRAADQVAAQERAGERRPGHAPAGVAKVLLEPADVGRAAGPIDPLEHEQDAGLAVRARTGGRHGRVRRGRSPVDGGGAVGTCRRHRRAAAGDRSADGRRHGPPARPADRGSRCGSATDLPRARRSEPIVGGQQASQEVAVGRRDGLGADRGRPLASARASAAGGSWRW